MAVHLSSLRGAALRALLGLDLDLRVELRHRRLLRGAAAELADDDGEDEDEDGRADAEADDERRGALLGFVAFAVRFRVFRCLAGKVEGVRAGAAVEDVVGALVDGERVVVFASLRNREASTRASGRARAGEAATDGDPGWTRETLTKRWFSLPLKTMSAFLPSPAYACAKRRRERRVARADEATMDGDPGWTRETLTWRRFLSPFTAMTSSPPPPYALC